MSYEEIVKKVIEVFSTMTEAEDINEDSELIEDLEITSMDVLYLMSSLEVEFAINIPEKEIRKMSTIGDVADVIENLLKK